METKCGYEFCHSAHNISQIDRKMDNIMFLHKVSKHPTHPTAKSIYKDKKNNIQLKTVLEANVTMVECGAV